MNKLKIGYLADGIWGHNAFKLINADDNFEICFITPRFDTTDETLKNFATENNIAYLKTKNINSEEFLSEIEKYNCDVLVSMSFNQIFKEPVLSKYKVINCHAGKLPFYRGRNILNWVLINDEKEFGITVHYVDEGIDTGDIILQKTYPITDEDNYNTLLTTAHQECAKLLYEALIKIKNNDVNVIKQNTIHPVGMYCGMRKFGDENIDWHQTSRELFNFIRAICKPSPMATTTLNDKPFCINKSEMIKDAPIYKGIPGQVLYKDKDGNFIVKTKDSILKITEYYYDGKVKVGDRLI